MNHLANGTNGVPGAISVTKMTVNYDYTEKSA